MRMLVAVDGVLRDLDPSTEGSDGVSPGAGEPVPDDEEWCSEPERCAEPAADGPG